MQIIRHCYIHWLLRIHLANICLPIFLNSWSSIYQNKTKQNQAPSKHKNPPKIQGKLPPDSWKALHLCSVTSKFYPLLLAVRWILFFFLFINCMWRKIVLLNTDPNWLFNKCIKEVVHVSPQNLPQVPLRLFTKPPPENEREKKELIGSERHAAHCLPCTRRPQPGNPLTQCKSRSLTLTFFFPHSILVLRKNLAVKALEKKPFVHRQIHFPYSALLQQAKEQKWHSYFLQ